MRVLFLRVGRWVEVFARLVILRCRKCRRVGGLVLCLASLKNIIFVGMVTPRSMRRARDFGSGLSPLLIRVVFLRIGRLRRFLIFILVSIIFVSVHSFLLILMMRLRWCRLDPLQTSM